MSTGVKPPQGRNADTRIGRLNGHWHPHVSHHAWTPRAFLLAVLALAVMVTILIVALYFVFSTGAL